MKTPVSARNSGATAPERKKRGNAAGHPPDLRPPPHIWTPGASHHTTVVIRPREGAKPADPRPGSPAIGHSHGQAPRAADPGGKGTIRALRCAPHLTLRRRAICRLRQTDPMPCDLRRPSLRLLLSMPAFPPLAEQAGIRLRPGLDAPPSARHPGEELRDIPPVVGMTSTGVMARHDLGSAAKSSQASALGRARVTTGPFQPAPGRLSVGRVPIMPHRPTPDQQSVLFGSRLGPGDHLRRRLRRNLGDRSAEWSATVFDIVKPKARRIGIAAAARIPDLPASRARRPAPGRGPTISASPISISLTGQAIMTKWHSRCPTSPPIAGPYGIERRSGLRIRACNSLERPDMITAIPLATALPWSMPGRAGARRGIQAWRCAPPAPSTRGRSCRGLSGLQLTSRV